MSTEIIFAILGVLLVWSVLVVLIIRHERHNAAVEAVAAHRIRVVIGGQVVVNATVGMLRHLDCVRRQPVNPGETVVVLGCDQPRR